MTHNSFEDDGAAGSHSWPQQILIAFASLATLSTLGLYLTQAGWPAAKLGQGMVVAGALGALFGLTAASLLRAAYINTATMVACGAIACWLTAWSLASWQLGATPTLLLLACAVSALMTHALPVRFGLGAGFLTAIVAGVLLTLTDAGLSATLIITASLSAIALSALARLPLQNQLQAMQEALRGQRGEARRTARMHADNIDKEARAKNAMAKKLADAQQRLSELERSDTLTRLCNRQSFSEAFEREFQRAQRESQPISLLFCDIDHFKAYNQAYSQAAGDQLLRDLADILRNTCGRPTDVIARFADTVFAVALPNTSIAQGRLVANRILNRVNEAEIPHRLNPVANHVTMSVGMSSVIPNQEVPVKRLTSLAAAALRDAKAQGRNRVTVEAVSLVDDVPDQPDTVENHRRHLRGV